MVRRTPGGVRVRTRRGYDWTPRFPLIVEAAPRLPATSCVLDSEGVILRSDGMSDFEALRSHRHDDEVQLLAFDLPELDGADLRRERLDQRKMIVAACCINCHVGIAVHSRCKLLRLVDLNGEHHATLGVANVHAASDEGFVLFDLKVECE